MSECVEQPPGEWVDHRDAARVLSGTVPGHPVPLGREPIFIRHGAVIPMRVERDHTGHGTSESAGSLTVVVHPDESAPTSFRCRQDATSKSTTTPRPSSASPAATTSTRQSWPRHDR